jgi:RHS repeat-associated protein
MDILQETVAGATTTTYRYIHGPGIDEPLARQNTATSAIDYYHADGLGSIVHTTDSAGAIVSTRRYDAWGKPEASADQPGFAFTGREWDPETGLYYYRARYYAPKIGRFLSQDPIGFAAGPNFYNYVGNRPVTLIDPLGLYSFDELLYDAAQFSAGLGDTLSFGLTGRVRDAMGTNDLIDKCSGIYAAGEWTGVAVSTAMGAAAGAKAAGTKMAGREFSHWIPTRMGGPRSVFNGNYVTAARHYLHDPFRYPAGWRALGDKLPAALQQLDRVPNVFKGTAAGAAYGGASMASNDCKCQ